MSSNDIVLWVLLGGMVVAALVFFGVYILFLRSMMKTLSAVRPENRQMSPAMVWLNLIPLFNLIWIFYTVIQLGESVVREARDRSLSLGDGGKILGVFYGIFMVITFLSFIIFPIIGLLFNLIGLVLLIVYWVDLVKFRKTFSKPTRAQET